MKFWNFRNEADSESADLLLYGPISDTTWWGDEVTPLQFASDLAALEGKNVNVRINSPGGDVFAAHAILNQLASYSGDVTVYVDGLAASAATIIMMAGKVIMPTNSMVMIHNPSAGLWGYYDEDQMIKMAADLKVIKQSIMNAYKTKSHLDDKKLSKLMTDETWMTAETAQEYGFVDEIANTSDITNMVMDGSYFIVNSVKHELKQLKNTIQLKSLVNRMQTTPIKNEPKEEKKVEIKTIDDLKNAHPDLINQAVSETIKNERSRVAALDAMDDIQNPAVHEIINDAKINGKTVDEIKPIIDIVKKHAPSVADTKNAQNYFQNILKDNRNSNVDNIKANGESSGDDKQEAAAAINFMKGIINKQNGVKQ